MELYLWLIFSLAIGLTAGIFQNLFAKKYMVSDGDCFSFTLLRTFFSCVVLVLVAVISGDLATPSLYTVLFGALYGFLTCTSTVANTLALAKGGYATTSLVCSLQMLIPAFSGYFIWNEEIHYGQYIGIVLLFIGLFLCLWQGKEQRFSLKWLLCCLCNIAAVGTLGIVQKFHQNSDFKQELNAFLIVAFAVSILYLGAVLLLLQRSPSTHTTGKLSLPLALVAALVGACTAGNNLINTDLVGRMSSIIIFPVYNGAFMLLTLLASVLLFGEKFKVRQIAGFLIGAVGIVFIGNLVKNFL